MSVFGSIMSAIFGHAKAAPAGAQGQATSTSGTAPQPATASATGTAAPTAANANVDVGAVLTDLSSKTSEKLDWKHSIVDLMKLLKLDSSLAARKELATELGYTGKTDGSAEMNIWLHKQVMKKLAENGGKVPAELH
jgi:hypothetical protein